MIPTFGIRRKVIILVLLMALPAAGDEPKAPGKAPTGFNAVWADGAEGAWAVGDLGVVAETLDHGKIWHVLASPVKTALLAVWRSPDGDLFAAGEKGVVLRGSREGRWRRLRVARKILSGLEYDRTKSGPEIRSIWGDGRTIYLVGGKPGGGVALCRRARKQATLLDRTLACDFDGPFAVWGYGSDLFVRGRVYDCHGGDYSALDRSTDGGRHWTRLSPTWSGSPSPIWFTAAGASYELDDTGSVTVSRMDCTLTSPRPHSRPVASSAIAPSGPTIKARSISSVRVLWFCTRATAERPSRSRRSRPVGRPPDGHQDDDIHPKGSEVHSGRWGDSSGALRERSSAC